MFPYLYDDPATNAIGERSVPFDSSSRSDNVGTEIIFRFLLERVASSAPAAAVTEFLPDPSGTDSTRIVRDLQLRDCPSIARLRRRWRNPPIFGR